MRDFFLSGALVGCFLAGCSSSSSPHVLSGVTDAGKEGGSSSAACTMDSLSSQRDQCSFGPGSLAKDTIGGCTGSAIPVQHVVILMQENRSFDHYFGHLKGHGQDDVDVAPDTTTNPAPADAGPPIPWHHETSYCVEDTDHGWIGSHNEWDNGKNDGFAIQNVSTNDPTGHRALGYFDQTDLPFYYDLASTFAISDSYFCSLLGPTYPNRMFLAAGTSFGVVVTDITVLAPKGVKSVYQEMNDKNVTWTFYHSDLASLALFPDFSNDGGATHLEPVARFAADAAAGKLPDVSFVDPAYFVMENDEHPPSNIQLGQHFVWEQVQAVLKSPSWRSTAMFITYDEHGGYFDHVAPPSACVPDDSIPAIDAGMQGFDRLGFRVPLTLISPYAKRHFVSHVVHSHTSILRFLEAKFDLPAMTKRDANSDAMLDLFDFDHPNFDLPTFSEPAVDAAQVTACQTPSE